MTHIASWESPVVPRVGEIVNGYTVQRVEYDMRKHYAYDEVDERPTGNLSHVDVFVLDEDVDPDE